jgi:hypothetical protein
LRQSDSLAARRRERAPRGSAPCGAHGFGGVSLALVAAQEIRSELAAQKISIL